MKSTRPTAASTPGAMPGWRAATATRVFALALIVGDVVRQGALPWVGLLLLALAVLAILASVVDSRTDRRTAPLVPVAEGLLATILLGSATVDIGILVPYLAVAPVVAGIRIGILAVINTTLLTVSALVGTWITRSALVTDIPTLETAVHWLVVGMGVGLLAAWQTRGVRADEGDQGPYREAHRLLTALNNVSSELSEGLDPCDVSAAFLAELTPLIGPGRLAIYSPERGTIAPLAQTGRGVTALEQRLVSRCVETAGIEREGTVAAIPIRAGITAVAVLAVTSADLGDRLLVDLQRRADQASLRLNTALLFGQVRQSATSQERYRLARDIHDGVAQDVAALGYLVDELGYSDDEEVRAVSATLRRELSKVTGELRSSIYDLRHEVGGDRTLVDALTEYTRNLGRQADIQVHLSSAVEGTRSLSNDVEEELLRITHEALTNVRKHARASNVWVHWALSDTHYLLEISDDGVGGADHRAGHFGLDGMAERAHRAGGSLLISTRPGGGTRVTAASGTPPRPGGVHSAGEPQLQESTS